MKSLLKSLLFSVSIFGLIALCADGDFYEYGSETSNSLFTPEIIGDTEFKPFFKTEMSQYYGFEDVNKGFYNQNISDWVAYFENKVDSADIEKVLYQSKLHQIDTLIFYLQNSKIPISKQLKSSSLLSYSSKEKTLEFLYYLGFALRCEAFSNNPIQESWEYEPKSFKNNELLLKLLKGGLKQGLKSTSDFVKERYFFQLVRLHYFNEDYVKCETFFEENKQMFQHQSLIYYRSLGYVAAALYKRKQFGRANLLYATLFVECKPMRGNAHWSFHPQEENDFLQSIKLAANDKQKIALYFLMGYSNDGVRALKEILKIDPKSAYVPVLLTREINKLEYRKLNYEGTINDFSEEDSELIAILEAENKKAKEAYWRIALGYTYLLMYKSVEAEVLFKKAEAESNNNLIHKSVALYRAISKIKSVEKLDAASEAQLLPHFELLLSTDENEKYLRKNWAIGWLNSRITGIYKNQKDDLKAECWQSNSVENFYESNENIDKMLAFIEKPTKTAYDNFLLEKYDFSKEDILTSKSINLVFKKELKQALAIYENYNLPKDKELLGDPFLIHINDCHDCDHQAKQKVKYTTYTFINELIKLNENVGTETSVIKKAEILFKIANGYYNITHFGNARYFYQTNVNYYDDYSYGFDSYYDDESYEKHQKLMIHQPYSSKNAEEFYQKALSLSNDKEFKAKCTFMLAKCEQNDFFLHKPKDYEGDFKAGEYFASLKKEYSLTAYYKEIIRECGYFVSYLKQK